jgi:release factor glutamine methyltransferase
MADVRNHEPRIALDGGDDGLAPHRLILAALRERLAPGGLALLEIGHTQGPAALEVARAAGFSDARLVVDLGGRDRCLAVAAPAG